MSDDVLKITITAAGEQAKAELQKVAQALSGVTRESHNVAAAHANHAKEAEKLGKQLDSTVKHLEFMATGFHNFRAIFAGGAAAFGFVEIINQTMRWDEELQRLSQVMNGNTIEASRWMARAEAFNVPVDSLVNGMNHLSLLVANHSKVLSDNGIATEDARGKYLSFDQILQEVTTHFQQNVGATDAAGQASQIFGRNFGGVMLPALQAAPATLQQIYDEAQKLGLIIDSKTMKSFRELEAEIARAGTAFHALELAIGHKLIEALAAAGQAIASFISAHIDQLVAAIQNVVSFIIGFFEAFTGGTFQVSALAQAIGSAAQATDDFGTASGGAANSAKALTDALQDQIKAIDEQIKGLQEVTQLENYQDSLRKLQQKATDDKKKVDLDYAHYQENLLLGNQQQAMTVLDSLAAAQQTATNDQLEIKKAEDDETRRLRINSLNDQKAKLQEQIAAIQDAAAKGTAAIAGAAGQWPGIIGGAVKTAGDAAADAFSTAGEKAGNQFGQKIKKWFDEFTDDKTRMKAIEDAGGAIGDALMKGIVDHIGEGLKNLHIIDTHGLKITFNNPFAAPPGASNDRPYNPISNPYGEKPPGFAGGGIIPGLPGEPKLILGHGQERVLNQRQRQAYESGGGGRMIQNVINLNIGSVDSHERVDELDHHIRMVMAQVIAQ